MEQVGFLQAARTSDSRQAKTGDVFRLPFIALFLFALGQNLFNVGTSPIPVHQVPSRGRGICGEERSSQEAYEPATSF